MRVCMHVGVEGVANTLKLDVSSYTNWLVEESQADFDVLASKCFYLVTPVGAVVHMGAHVSQPVAVRVVAVVCFRPAFFAESVDNLAPPHTTSAVQHRVCTQRQTTST